MVASRVIAGLLVSVLVGLGVPVWSQTSNAPEQYYVLDVPQRPVIEALKEFTTQTGLQVSFWPDAQTDQAMLIGPLRGKFTLKQALTRLLAQSNLTFQRTNDRSIVVMAPSMLAESRGGSGAASEDEDRQAEGKPGLSLQNSPPPPAPPVALGRPGSASDDGGDDRLAEVIVTGSRLERYGEGPAPVQVFTRETIQQLGAASVPDVLRYMPQQPFSRPEYYYSNSAQYSQMRGIGVDTTLILINGRRVVPTSNSLVLNAFDLNTIPLAAVEEIQVLSDSASAIYGADAMGGVINIVLKKKVPQPSIDLQVGGPKGGGQRRRASLSAGYSTQRFRSSLMVDLQDRDFLLGRERDRWANQDFTRYGGTDYRSLAGSPGSVRSIDGTNLPGLSAPFAMVPAGSHGIGLTSQDFIATAGMRNRTSTMSTLSIMSDVQQRNVAAFMEFDLNPQLMLFADVLYSNRRTVFQDELYSVQGATVSAGNPFNPFQRDVWVDFLLQGIEPRRSTQDLELGRGVLGLRGALGSTWQWEVAAVGSTETNDLRVSNQVIGARVSAALSSSNPSLALNPFVDGPAGSPALLASLIQPEIDRHFSRGRQLSAFARGELLSDLPEGPVRVVMGGEWRDEAMIYDDSRLPVDDSRVVKAIFAELNVPLVGPARGSSGDMLALTAAARVDDYSDFGSTLNPQFGVMWRPLSDWLLRASYGTSFRPPSLFELRSPRYMVPNVSVPDPWHPGAPSKVATLIGGNPDLQPIEAESMTAGFVFSPDAVPEFHLLANYWRIRTDHRVTVLPFSTLMAHEDLFRDRIVRAAPTPQEQAAGIPGRLLQMDLSRLNFGRLTTSGVDLAFKYEWETDWGKFTQQVSATWVNDFTAVDVPTTSPIQRVGVANSAGSIPRWRVVGGIGWQYGGLGLSTNLDWLPGYMDATISGLTGRRLPARTLVDLQATLTMDELLGSGPLWSDLKLQLGVKNLFDEMPPFAAVGFSTGFDNSQGDLIGRVGYLRLSKGF